MSLAVVDNPLVFPDLSRVPAVDEVGVNERVARFQSRAIKNASKVEALKLVLSMIDLTTLEGQTRPARCGSCATRRCTCTTASRPAACRGRVRLPEHGVASRKEHSRAAASGRVGRHGIPERHGLARGQARRRALCGRAGADEIDMVISRGAFLSGDYRAVFDEIVAVKEACGGAHLKVILETGELGSLDHVRRASVLAMHAGADFIKTSTGKIQPAATMPVTLVMLEAIRDYYHATGRRWA